MLSDFSINLKFGSMFPALPSGIIQSESQRDEMLARSSLSGVTGGVEFHRGEGICREVSGMLNVKWYYHFLICNMHLMKSPECMSVFYPRHFRTLWGLIMTSDVQLFHFSVQWDVALNQVRSRVHWEKPGTPWRRGWILLIKYVTKYRLKLGSFDSLGNGLEIPNKSPILFLYQKCL